MNRRLQQISLAVQNEGERLSWKSSEGQEAAEAAQPLDLHVSCDEFFIDELDIRSFALQFEPQ
jgi:hypothetical protein